VVLYPAIVKRSPECGEKMAGTLKDARVWRNREREIKDAFQSKFFGRRNIQSRGGSGVNADGCPSKRVFRLSPRQKVEKNPEPERSNTGKKGGRGLA